MDRVIALGATELFKFTTRDFDTGSPQTLGGTPAISAYEDASLTQITAGITLTADFDSVTGLNHVAVVASSANGYEAGKLYNLVITTGTVDTVSVVGEVVATFRIETAAEAAIREANEALFLADTPTAFTGNTTTAVNLSGIVDSSARADDLINEILLLKWEGGTFDGLALLAVVTDYAVTNQLATVELLGTGGALPEAIASGDKVIRTGAHVFANVEKIDNANVSTTTAQIGVNVEQINTVAITGDGSATPFNV